MQAQQQQQHHLSLAYKCLCTTYDELLTLLRDSSSSSGESKRKHPAFETFGGDIEALSRYMSDLR